MLTRMRLRHMCIAPSQRGRGGWSAPPDVTSRRLVVMTMDYLRREAAWVAVRIFVKIFLPAVRTPRLCPEMKAMNEYIERVVDSIDSR